jgi:diadenosine tetraphosphate (Ap4A) HIT family hydrolase
VICNAHAREMTDLAPADRTRLMETVFAVESALREVMQPLKINLASLGNMVPHVHWHVIPRYEGDAHFPQPIWSARRREPDAQHLAALRALLPKLEEEIRARV